MSKPVDIALSLSLLLLASVPVTGRSLEPEQEQPVYFVGFAQDTMDNDWRSAQVRGLANAFASYPQIRFVYTNARGHSAQQIQDAEDLVAREVDLLMTSPRDGLAMEPAIARIYRAGTPVVLLTRRIPGESFTSFVAPDDEAIAARAADVLAEHLAGKGRILVLRGVPTATTAIHRTRGFRQALKRHPGMEIVAMPAANYLRADALHAMEKVLSDGTGFDAIFAESDSMAAGARMALRASGIDPRSIPIVGIDYIREAREAIRNGEQLASFTYPTCAREGAEQVARILEGKPYAREVRVESILVTRENVDEVEPIF